MAEATGPQLVAVAIEDEMRQAYLDYSMSVIVGRALPDVRDGLKPVHRRILYAMFEQGMLHNKRYSKCAGTVGEVLKKYHPHGDAAVYDALDTEDAFVTLMGDKVEPRRLFIEKHAKEVKNLDI